MISARAYIVLFYLRQFISEIPPHDSEKRSKVDTKLKKSKIEKKQKFGKNKN